MKKIIDYLPFFALLIVPLALYPGVDTSGWKSSNDVHACIEFASSLLAVTAGMMVLLHFITTGRRFFLIISIGFVLIGAEEFIHAIFSFDRMWPETHPTFKLAISVTWLTGHCILLMSFFIALSFGYKEIVPAKRVLDVVVYNVSGLIITAAVALIIFNSPILPHFVLIGSITKRLIELTLALAYFVAFLFYSNIYVRQQPRSPLLGSIVAFIIMRVLAHLFVFDSSDFYDAHWDMAHLLVLLSYFFPILGVWGETIKSYATSKAHLIVLSDEMNERKRVEDALRESKVRFDQLARQSGTYTWEVDDQGLYTYVSNVAKQVIGYHPDELTGRIHFYDLHPESGRDGFKAAAFAVFERKEPFLNLVNAIQTKDGRKIWVSTNGIPLLKTDGTLRGYRGSDTDITERKQAEEALAFQQKFSAAILENMDAGVVVCNEKGELVLFNRTARNWHGLDPLNIPQTQWASHYDLYMEDGVTPLDINTVPLAMAFRGEKLHNSTMVIAAKGQPKRHILAHASPITDEHGLIMGAVAVMQDITERKHAEEELTEYRIHLEEIVEERTSQLNESRATLQRSERLASIGTLAAGIAHEINNPLGMLLLSMDVALASMDKPDKLADLLRKQKDDVQRCAHIVKGVLDFARQRPTDKTPLDLNDVVRHSLDFTREYAANNNVSVEVQLADSSSPVFGNATELEQVVVNLVNNGVQACNNGGHVVIETNEANGKIRLVARDNGCGLTAEQVEHIFDPFFTTRLAKGGTGLGLSTVHGIVTSHKGTIEVSSEPAKGTVFTIELPRHTETEPVDGKDTGS